MNCPSCQDQRLTAHRRAGIEIDVCPHCKGVWLDRNELDQLIEASGGPAAARFADRPRPADHRNRVDDRHDRPNRRDDDDDDDDDHDDRRKRSRSKKKRRKKSWGERLEDALEELIDL